jgi:hypothetical protein
VLLNLCSGVEASNWWLGFAQSPDEKWLTKAQLVSAVSNTSWAIFMVPVQSDMLKFAAEPTKWPSFITSDDVHHLLELFICALFTRQNCTEKVAGELACNFGNEIFVTSLVQCVN